MLTFILYSEKGIELWKNASGRGTSHTAYFREVSWNISLNPKCTHPTPPPQGGVYPIDTYDANPHFFAPAAGCLPPLLHWKHPVFMFLEYVLIFYNISRTYNNFIHPQMKVVIWDTPLRGGVKEWKVTLVIAQTSERHKRRQKWK